MDSRRVRGVVPALAVAAIVLLLPIVALASRPESGSGAPLLPDDPARVAFDVITYLLLIAALLGLLIIVWALWPRPGEQLPPLPRRRGHLAMALAMAGAVLIAVWLRSHQFSQLPNLAQSAAGSPGGGAAAVVPRTSRAGGGGIDWIALAIVVGLVVVAAFLAWRAMRTVVPGSRRSALASVQALLDDAIEDVLAEADPRRAVIAAWARLERVLASHRLPRREAEAPLEYASRVRVELGVERVSLERLADLYEWARFSLNEVTPAMRQEALDGLLSVRDGLRVAA